MYEHIVKRNVDEQRFQHTIGVVNYSKIIAKKYGVNVIDAINAAYLHDLTKNQKVSWHKEMIDVRLFVPDQCLHAYSVRKFTKILNLEIKDEILDAIECHVEGCANASDLSMVLYISDYIEDSRTYASCLKCREYALSGDYTLKELYATVLDFTYESLMQRDFDITMKTLEAYKMYEEFIIKN